MLNLDEVFKFQIGARVMSAMSVDMPAHERQRAPYIVTDRILHECHGGVQRQYLLGACTASVPLILIRDPVPELLLVAWEPPPED